MSKYLFLLFLLLACQSQTPIYNSRFLAFGTVINISIAGGSLQQAQQAIDAVEKEFHHLNQIWHAWQPSLLTETNQKLQSGQLFTVPSEIMPLLKKAKQLSQKSEGLFNPAIGQLIRLWGFQRSEFSAQKPPQDKKIKALLSAHPSMENIHIQGKKAQCDNPAVQLDFGGIGKGYGIDLAMNILKSKGIQNAIINAGGDLRAIGQHGDRPWRIAIRHPSGTGSLGLIRIQGDESVFTSGNYERNYIWQGHLYHHIIDPRTGYPAQGIKSVTVIHHNATEADAAATALMIAGTDWYRIAQKMGLRFVLVVDEQNIIHMNPAMADRVQLFDQTKIQISPPLQP